MDLMADLHELGYVRGAYGVRGMVRVHPFGSLEGGLVCAKTWYLKHEKTDQIQVCEVVQAKSHGDEVVARLKECKDRTQAESFKGWTVWVSREAFPEVDEETFYWVDLIGLICVDMQGDQIGFVKEVFENGAQSVLVVQRQTQKEGQWIDLLSQEGKSIQLLVPFVMQHVPLVDLKEGCLQVDWPLDF